MPAPKFVCSLTATRGSATCPWTRTRARRRARRRTRCPEAHHTRRHNLIPRLGALFVALGLVFAILPTPRREPRTSGPSGCGRVPVLHAAEQHHALRPASRRSRTTRRCPNYTRNWSYQMGAAQNLVHSPNLTPQTAAAVPDWNHAGREHRPGWQRRHAAPNRSTTPRRTRANMLGAYNQVGVGVVVVGTEIWVTFRFANGSAPAPRDATPPSTVMNAPLAASPKSRASSSPRVGGARTPVRASPTSTSTSPRTAAVGSGGSTASHPKYLAGADAAGDYPFFGAPGRSYSFRVQAVDHAGNTSGTSPTLSTAVSASAPKPMPLSATYAIGRKGEITALSSVPITGPQWTSNTIRGFAVQPQGGGYEVDFAGGVWAVGGAPAVAPSRVLRRVGHRPRDRPGPRRPGGYVLDGLGGL